MPSGLWLLPPERGWTGDSKLLCSPLFDGTAVFTQRVIDAVWEHTARRTHVEKVSTWRQFGQIHFRGYTKLLTHYKSIRKIKCQTHKVRLRTLSALYGMCCYCPWQSAWDTETHCHQGTKKELNLATKKKKKLTWLKSPGFLRKHVSFFYFLHGLLFLKTEDHDTNTKRHVGNLGHSSC